MFETAFIQEHGNGRLMLENQLVRDYCLKLGIEIRLYTIKRIRRRELPLTSRSFICGDMDCMHGAMKQLNIPIPAPRDEWPCVSSPSGPRSQRRSQFSGA